MPNFTTTGLRISSPEWKMHDSECLQPSVKLSWFEAAFQPVVLGVLLKFVEL